MTPILAGIDLTRNGNKESLVLWLCGVRLSQIYYGRLHLFYFHFYFAFLAIWSLFDAGSNAMVPIILVGNLFVNPEKKTIYL